MNKQRFSKDIFTNVVSNIIASVLTPILIFLISLILSVFGLYFVAIVLAIIGCIMILKKIRRNIVSFYWTHIYDEDIHTYELKQNQEFTHTEKVSVLKQSNRYNNKIKGYFDWDDTEIISMDFDIEGRATVECYVTEKGTTKVYNEKHIDFNSSDITRVEYEIEFHQNTTKEAKIIIKGKYNENTPPNFYVDIKRPIKKLDIAVKTYGGVTINNVVQKITPVYGEIPESKIPAAETQLECVNNDGNCVYTLSKKNPKLLHSYEIKWNWMKIQKSSHQ